MWLLLLTYINHRRLRRLLTQTHLAETQKGERNLSVLEPPLCSRILALSPEESLGWLVFPIIPCVALNNCCRICCCSWPPSDGIPAPAPQRPGLGN